MKELIKKAANKVARSYLDDGQDPTEALAKLASGQDLNARHIDRIATQANRDIIVALSKEGVQKDSDVDPHFTFPTVKTADVIGLIKRSPTMAEPTPPAPRDRKPDIDDIMPAPETPCGATGAQKADEIVDSSGVEMSFPNKEVAFRVIRKLKEIVDKKRRTYHRLSNKLEDVVGKLHKRAEQELLNGTPLEVLEAMPGADDEIQKVARQVHEKGGDVVHDETPFELDYDHPLVKQAQRIEELEARVADAEQDYEHEQARLEQAKHEARRVT